MEGVKNDDTVGRKNGEEPLFDISAEQKNLAQMDDKQERDNINQNSNVFGLIAQYFCSLYFTCGNSLLMCILNYKNCPMEGLENRICPVDTDKTKQSTKVWISKKLFIFSLLELITNKHSIVMYLMTRSVLSC
jgi:hypothetical protein